MKRVANLFDRIVSFESLHRAAFEVLRGKRGREHAGDLFRDLEGTLIRLQRELLDGTYQPGAYRAFWIREPKARLISAAPLRDRIVHHALIAAIEPHFERGFIDHSYACRTGRGTHRALAEFVRRARSSTFVLKMDIAKYFPTIDHAILKRLLRRKLKDPRALWLADAIIDGSNLQGAPIQYFAGDSLLTPIERRRGIPIGNLTSQFFANVYLDQLDHFVVDRQRHGRYLRYVDDFCLFGDDKNALRDLRARISTFLGADLRLKLNERKSRLRRVSEGIEFLGFVITPDQIRLSQTAIRRQRRRMRWQRRTAAEGGYDRLAGERSFEGWSSHAAHGTTWRLRQRVARSLPGREERAMVPADRD